MKEFAFIHLNRSFCMFVKGSKYVMHMLLYAWCVYAFMCFVSTNLNGSHWDIYCYFSTIIITIIIYYTHEPSALWSYTLSFERRTRHHKSTTILFPSRSRSVIFYFNDDLQLKFAFCHNKLKYAYGTQSVNWVQK